MKYPGIYLTALIVFVVAGVRAQRFTIEQATAYPFPSELTVSPQGSKFAVAINQQGRRNIFAGEAPEFQLRQVTRSLMDDAQELTSLCVTPDGKWIVYVRGGDHGAYDETVPHDPLSLPVRPRVTLMLVPFAGGEPKMIDEGDHPVISPDGKKIAYIKNDEVWHCDLEQPFRTRRMFYTRGAAGSVSWSPDSRKLLFVSNRKDHSFVGIFTDSLTPIQWIAPAFSRDQSPQWSADGRRIVFVRRDAAGGSPDSLTVMNHQPWAIWVADVSSGSAKPIWTAPRTLRGSVPGTQGRYNLHWASGDQIVFVSYHDGWPHLYSLPAGGGEAMLLTRGNYMLEHISLSQDKKWIVASANTGSDSNDLHRRHILRVPVNKAEPQILTQGAGIETFPMITADGLHVIFLKGGIQQPTVVATVPFRGGRPHMVSEHLIPPDFPSEHFVTPRPVKFTAADGGPVYAQLFEPQNNKEKKPAVVFVHGGPSRQMLLGWHYGDYYANTYALNQYLVQQGFIVLSVNYRLGIGYGFEFQHPPGAWVSGASEYLDIQAAGEWLQRQPQVDTSRIGIYGGSYGGFLTALALGKNSDIFKAGVDIHGVHTLAKHYPDTESQKAAPDAELARELLRKSAPINWLDDWTSPVLLIHGDDDGNVNFSESVELAKRFQQKGFDFESLVIPDETHHWLRYANMVQVNKAVAEFLHRKLIQK